MRKLWIVPCVLALAGLAAADQQPASKTSCDAKGEIVAFKREAKSLQIKKTLANGDKDTLSFHVDEDSVPGWYLNFKVGDDVSLTCKDVPERGPTVVGMKKVE